MAHPSPDLFDLAYRTPSFGSNEPIMNACVSVLKSRTSYSFSLASSACFAFDIVISWTFFSDYSSFLLSSSISFCFSSIASRFWRAFSCDCSCAWLPLLTASFSSSCEIARLCLSVPSVFSSLRLSDSYRCSIPLSDLL